jgi:hypothetical protein
VEIRLGHQLDLMEISARRKALIYQGDKIRAGTEDVQMGAPRMVYVSLKAAF